MANPEFQPPPTWAPVILEIVDPATGEKKATFNPVWLKWFVDLTSVLTNSGGGTGTISLAAPAGQIAFGNADNVLSTSDDFKYDSVNRILKFGVPGTGGSVRGEADGSGGASGAFIVAGGDGAGGGGDVSVLGGDSSGGDAGNVFLTGGAGPSGLGGDVTLEAGQGGTDGNIILSNLPTAAPGVSGALWRDAGAGNVVKCVP